LDLLPQRPPFIMVDKLIHFDRIKTITEFLVKPDNLFFDEGRFTSSGLIENIAQTCAARMGYINHISNQHIKLGFIGAIRNLQIFRTPVADELLITSIEVKEEIFQMTLVDAAIKSGDELLVKAEMKIALSNIDSQN
jgi:predicted hotdog family 3-hydroxylacyl-ACP dehydratase